MENFNFELAERFCTRAIELSPDNLQALDMATSVYLELGKVDEAVSVSFLYTVKYRHRKVILPQSQRYFSSSIFSICVFPISAIYLWK